MDSNPCKVTVKADIAFDTQKPVSETISLVGDSRCILDVAVKPGATATEIPLTPPIKTPPKFVLLRPGFPDKKKTPYTAAPNAAAEIEYSTSKDSPASGQRKPLRGLQMFFNGQEEWITDRLGEGGDKPGPLTRLFVWNNLVPDPALPQNASEKEKKEAEEKLTVMIQIFICYDAVPPEPDTCPPTGRR